MKVTIVTQAYNVVNYIDQCIKSVLNQTYSDFKYILIDNGSTDGSGEIMKRYADKDSRIEFIQFEQNGSGRWIKSLYEFGEGEFFTVLDSDDWLEPDYLEKLVDLAESTNSDIVTTGSLMHLEKTSQVSERKASKRLVLDKQDLSIAFPYFHVFFRAVWAKLIRIKILKNTNEIDLKKLGIGYGGDTLYSFSWLRQANRICVDNSVLHHYRIHQKSVSHKYDPRQSYSDIYLFNDALDFLKPFGPVSADNMEFLYRVYANAIIDTVTNIRSSTLSPEEKLQEYQKILARPETKNAFNVRSDDTANCKVVLISAFLEAAAELSSENAGLCQALSEYFPQCAKAVSPDSAGLFLAEKPTFKALLNDDKNALAENLLLMIEKQKYAKQFDLGKIICALAQDKPLLDKIADTKFIRKNIEIYRLTWLGKYSEALDSMTDKLLHESVKFEEFFELYLSIAAGLECVDEFIFGKIKLAQFCVNEKRFDECRAVLEEISEMGVEDNDDITEIKRKLNS